jgi:hypothetical protein
MVSRGVPVGYGTREYVPTLVSLNIHRTGKRLTGMSLSAIPPQPIWSNSDNPKVSWSYHPPADLNASRNALESVILELIAMYKYAEGINLSI